MGESLLPSFPKSNKPSGGGSGGASPAPSVPSYKIERFQKILANKMPGTNVPQNGKFDKATHEALKHFMRMNDSKDPIWRALDNSDAVSDDYRATSNNLNSIIAIFSNNGMPKRHLPEEEEIISRDLTMQFDGSGLLDAEGRQGSPVQVTLPLVLMARSPQDMDMVIKALVLRRYYLNNKMPLPARYEDFDPAHVSLAIQEITQDFDDWIRNKPEFESSYALKRIKDGFIANLLNLGASYGKGAASAQQRQVQHYTQRVKQDFNYYYQIAQGKLAPIFDEWAYRILNMPGHRAIDDEGNIISEKEYNLAKPLLNNKFKEVQDALARGHSLEPFKFNRAPQTQQLQQPVQPQRQPQAQQQTPPPATPQQLPNPIP